jgi:translation initiation factor IF-1
LTRIEDTCPSDGKRRKPRSKISVLEKASAKLEEAQETLEETKCPHHFGYLAKRPRTEMSDECMVCSKILECMRTQPEGEASPAEKIPKPSKPDRVTGKTVEGEAKEEPRELEAARRDETRRTEDEFAVENLGMLFASWSDTVRIGKKILSSLGRKVKEVEIETADGKKARCKVQPMDEEERIIQMPGKLQSILQIRKGQFVKVRPSTERQD